MIAGALRERRGFYSVLITGHSLWLLIWSRPGEICIMWWVFTDGSVEQNATISSLWFQTEDPQLKPTLLKEEVSEPILYKYKNHSLPVGSTHFNPSVLPALTSLHKCSRSDGELTWHDGVRDVEVIQWQPQRLTRGGRGCAGGLGGWPGSLDRRGRWRGIAAGLEAVVLRFQGLNFILFVGKWMKIQTLSS